MFLALKSVHLLIPVPSTVLTSCNCSCRKSSSTVRKWSRSVSVFDGESSVMFGLSLFCCVSATCESASSLRFCRPKSCSFAGVICCDCRCCLLSLAGVESGLIERVLVSVLHVVVFVMLFVAFFFFGPFEMVLGLCAVFMVDSCKGMKPSLIGDKSAVSICDL